MAVRTPLFHALNNGHSSYLRIYGRKALIQKVSRSIT
jgi:hypothetical protein